MWLQEAIQKGTATTSRILKRFSFVEDIYRATRSDYTYIGVPDDTLEALCNKSLDHVMKLAERAERYGGWILTPDSSGYPSPLKHLYSPPLVLYGRGVLPDFERMPVIGIVGTRKCTEYGMTAAGGIAAGLAAVGCPVISGGAVGIDRAAHEGALYGGGITVAVQACGLDVDYPAPNRFMRERILEEGGALLSECPPGTTVTRSVFQVRNRLISGLSWGVCVVEAPRRSGALITARLARDQGKDVFAVPGAITSPQSVGCNTLIRDGACLVTSPADILREYQVRCGDMLDEEEALAAQQAFYDRRKVYREQQPKSSHSEPSADQEDGEQQLAPLPAGVSASCGLVYGAIPSTPVSAEWLFEKTGLPLGEIFSVLTELEIYGCIKNHPGQYYSK
jgi:DNA processing protein